MGITIIGGTPLNKMSSLGTNNVTNGPGMTLSAGPPAMTTLTGPVTSCLLTGRMPMGPHLHIAGPAVVPGPGLSPPGMGVPPPHTALYMGAPIATIAGQNITVPGPGPGVASGTPLGPCIVVPLP